MRTVIGIDYGTQSARAVLVDTENGNVLCCHSYPYPHGVMEGALVSAEDYENALTELLGAVTPEQYRHTISGICVDATSLTLVPLTKDLQIPERLPEYADRVHGKIKLWKRHTAQKQAQEALELAKQMQEPFLARMGMSLSSEWTLPKLLEIRDEDTEMYRMIDLAMDLCEFLTLRLTGKITRSAPSMGYKCLWARDLDFPSDAYLDRLRPGFAQEYRHLLRGEIYRPGEVVGFLTPQLCNRFGLSGNIPVAAGVIDGHTGAISLGAIHDGDAALVVGTSNVFAILTEKLHTVEGVCGITMDGYVPGLYGIETGQSGTGDMLAWLLNNAMGEQVQQQARKAGVSVHMLLADRVKNPWQCPLTVLDWFNGSRNVPCDLSLTGTIAGMTLETKPEDIYLAMLQAIACGTKEIVDQCAGNGVPIRRILATGGIARKNPLLMQQYANILQMPVTVGMVEEGPALGAAIYAAVAGGIYENLQEACKHMGAQEFTTYTPDVQHADAYHAIYQRNHALRVAVLSWYLRN